MSVISVRTHDVVPRIQCGGQRDQRGKELQFLVCRHECYFCYLQTDFFLFRSRPCHGVYGLT